MLVDDESYTRQGLRNLIDWEACGYRVTDEADNGEDAFAIIRSRQPDLVITDIRMPEMDGLELIRRSREELPASPSFIIISGYDDFSYAQQAVRYGVFDFVLKPIDEDILVSALQKLDQVLTRSKTDQAQQELNFSRQMIPQLMTGAANEASIHKWCEQQGIMLPDRFRYVLVEVNDTHPWREESEARDQDQTLRTIQHELSLGLQTSAHYYVHEHYKRFGFILPERRLSEINDGMALAAFAAVLHRDLSSQLRTPVYVYIGESVASLNRIGDSYRSASFVLQYKFISPSGVFLHDEWTGRPLNYANLEDAITKQLTDRVEENDIPGMMSSIDAIFTQFRDEHYTPEAVKLAIHHCVSALVRIMRQMGAEESDVRSIEPILSWQDLCITPGELKRLFTEFIIECAGRIAEHRKDGMKGSIAKVKDYIERHYQENISLKQLAVQFYMNPVYLGQLFRKAYDTYFNDYLCQIRLEQSRKLLRQTDMRIYEIAERVGFNNADYFVTKFEKNVGMTPTEYRNKLIGSNDVRGDRVEMAAESE